MPTKQIYRIDHMHMLLLNLNIIFMDFDKLKKQATSQYRPVQTGKLVPQPQGQFETIFQPIFLTCLIYPLKRIQANYQIKQTYAKQEIMKCKQFFTRCTHYGLTSWFRGMTPFFLKLSIPYWVYHSLQEPAKQITIQDNSKLTKNQMIQFVKCIGLAVAYTVIYPLENVRIRMGSDVQRIRLYRNIRDCMNKMRKSQGKSAFYRGYTLSLLYIQMQYLLSTNIFKYLLDQQKLGNLPNVLSNHTGLILFMSSFLLSQAILHPIDSIRKIYQISGSMNHQNYCPRYRDVITLYKSKLYSGFQYRLLSGMVYTTILICLQKNRSRTKAI